MEKKQAKHTIIHSLNYKEFSKFGLSEQTLVPKLYKERIAIPSYELNAIREQYSDATPISEVANRFAFYVYRIIEKFLRAGIDVFTLDKGVVYLGSPTWISMDIKTDLLSSTEVIEASAVICTKQSDSYRVIFIDGLTKASLNEACEFAKEQINKEIDAIVKRIKQQNDTRTH